MKNILMIGDSWGVPNYNSDWNTLPEAHTEYRLRNLGYKVFNYSLNGGSNIDTIEYARVSITSDSSDPSFLGEIGNKRNTYASKDGDLRQIPEPNYNREKIDWIIWFHTESIRIPINTFYYPYTTMQDLHDFSIGISYRAFANLVNVCKNPKTIVIGGQAPIDSRLFDYHNPTHVIMDWRSDITGRKLPFCHSLSRLETLKEMHHDKDTMLKYMDDHKIIYDSMLDEKLFFDRCHPGSIPHEQLTSKIHSWIQDAI
jgi:hypothetical protein